MRLEDLNDEFPKMPKEIRSMIEKEVGKQLKTEHVQFKMKKRTAGKTIAASIAAVLFLGTTVYAGVGIYRMQREEVGDYGVEVKVAAPGVEATQAAKEAGTESPETPTEIPNVKMEIGYLPDGMVETEEGKYSFADSLYKGGISIVLYRMDTGDHQFDMLHEDVLSSEDFTINGYEGVYLEFPHLFEDEITFNQRIYVAYPDVHYVMQMYAASDVAKEEAMKIAESIRLTPTEDENYVHTWDWSSYLASEKENVSNEQAEPGAKVTAAKEEMKNTHAVGESFSAEKTGLDQYQGLVVKVSDVQISDDISLLDDALVDDDFRKETDADGKLLPATIDYIKNGDADSLSKVVKSREVPQKLVYATVEYTNTGNEKLSEVLFFGSLVRITEEDDLMKISSLWTYEEPDAGDEWTQAVNGSMSGFSEMQYYDVHTGERNNNYIAAIEPGETVTVHMGWIVTEEELGKLYLNLDTFGGAYEFSDSSLELGYVDIRQQG